MSTTVTVTAVDPENGFKVVHEKVADISSTTLHINKFSKSELKQHSDH
ncbi:hypothetical protein CPS_2402 [Colwellia psychrerythraea 34H]|uniref:Uncharacterized protein n=1 Tax=Colwellia psychrerythraea (strain 34H / ATCC BAA-681) TaxID=167879 RepID=Q481Z9_COLP3|nr:hypothetical protein CPS_2402 [Colwellia psychrerythraea 34H]